jgi:hypothetical protein
MRNLKKFIMLMDWMVESEDSSSKNEFVDEEPEEKELFGCVMMDAKIDDWEENHLAGIDEEDIYLKPMDDSYGLEDNPHVTIVYGIHEDEIDTQTIVDVMENNMQPLTLPVTEIGVFEGKEYDVVKYNLEVTEQLKTYRNLFLKFPNTQSFPDYNPHITIAYVLPGKGQKYATKLREPFKIKFTKAVYSWHPNKDDDPDRLSRRVVNLEKKKDKDKKD